MSAQSPPPRNNASARFLLDLTTLSLATGFGLGRVPLAPGTWGSLLGVALAAAISPLDPPLRISILTLLTLVSAPICGRAATLLGKQDPGSCVLDEVVACALTLQAAPLTPFSACIGFALFRLFDITKPPPVRRAEQLPGGWGIVADDLVAAGYAAAVLWLVCGR
jgi:phosphatidylglycerophosphatase A